MKAPLASRGCSTPSSATTHRSQRSGALGCTYSRTVQLGMFRHSSHTTAALLRRASPGQISLSFAESSFTSSTKCSALRREGCTTCTQTGFIRRQNSPRSVLSQDVRLTETVMTNRKNMPQQLKKKMKKGDVVAYRQGNMFMALACQGKR